MISKHEPDEFFSISKENEMNKLLYSIVENSFEAIAITKSNQKLPLESKVVYANQAYFTLTGYTEEEVMGASPFDLASKNTDPQLLEQIKDTIKKQATLDHICKHSRKSGEVYWVNLSIAPFLSAEDSLFTVFKYRELTYEILLKESQQKYKSLFENHEDAVFALDKELGFTSVNSACESMTGFTKGELLQTSFLMLLETGEIAVQREIFDQVLKGSTITREFTFISKNEGKVAVNFTQIPIKTNGVFAGVYGIAKDISESKRLNRILNIERVVLEKIIAGEDLEKTIAYFLTSIESIYPDLFLTVMLANNDFTKLHCFSCPSLPESFKEGLQEIPIGQGAGACGTAAYSKKPVIVSNVQEDSLMVDFKALAKSFDINACWSFPIFSSNKSLLGTFAVYKHEEGGPPIKLEQLLNRAGNIIAILIENKRNEQAYKQINERLKLAMDATNEAIWDWDPITNAIYWGHGFETIFGYAMESLALGFEWWESNLHPDDKERVINSLEKVLQSDECYWTEEYHYKGKDGNYRYVLDRGNVIRDDTGKAYRMVGAILDLTDRKVAEKSLMESEERFRNLADATMEGIAITAKGKVLEINKSLAEMLGRTRDEVIGKSSLDFTKKEYHDMLKSRIENQQEDTYEITVIRKDGSTFPSEVRGINTTYKGKLARITSIRDISEKKKSEKAMLDHAKELARSNEELERFAYMASHDLQEPLRMVTSFLQLLHQKYKGKWDETGNNYINFAIDGAERMKILINDLLRYSKISFQDEEKSEIDLNELLKNLIPLFEEQIKVEGGKLIIEKMPIVKGDKTLLHQLFQNLIGNALKYKSKKPPEITISVEDKKKYWHFKIKDNGIGIEEKFYEKIFVVFQRLHTRTEYSGTGIGLAVCKKIVEKYGGEIWVKSEPKNGCEFNFTILK